MNNQYTRAVSIYVRCLYSPGYSSLMISFFNTNFSIMFTPFESKDPTGRSFYDSKKILTTTINYENAAALSMVVCDIIEGKDETKESLITLTCAGNASLTLERKPGQDGQMETLLTIYKNNTSIPFKFGTIKVQRKENGQMVTKTIESGLGAFAKTINGYLSGINASGHLNKLGDDLEKFQEDEQQRMETINAQYQGNTGQYQQGNYSSYTN